MIDKNYVQHQHFLFFLSNFKSYKTLKTLQQKPNTIPTEVFVELLSMLDNKTGRAFLFSLQAHAQKQESSKTRILACEPCKAHRPSSRSPAVLIL